MSFFDVRRDRNIFALPIQMENGVRCNALSQRGLIRKLMCQLVFRGHLRGVGPGSACQAVIQLKRRQANVRTFGIRHFQELRFSLVVIGRR